MLNSTELTFDRDTMVGIRESVDELMVLKTLLRPYAPDFTITDKKDLKKITKVLKRVGKHLVPLFKDLNLCADISIDDLNLGKNQLLGSSKSSAGDDSSKKSGSSSQTLIKSSIDLLERVGKDYLLVGSNSVRDKIKKLGVDAFKIISTGGPISTEDLKQLNPKIPDKALAGYQKKINALVNKIKAIVNKGETMLYLMGVNDENDTMIGERLSDLEKEIEYTFPRVLVMNWDEIN